MITAADLATLLARGRFDLTVERATQDDIETFLRGALPEGCALVREARLAPGERPDFLVGDCIAVEVKVKGAAKRAIFRQLERYARHEVVRELVLCTNVAMGLPAEIGGKPVYVVNLGRAWL